MGSDKRPGRPLTPGNQPGNDGNPVLRIRLNPSDLERVRRAGGSKWARCALLEALEAQALEAQALEAQALEAQEGARGEE